MPRILIIAIIIALAGCAPATYTLQNGDTLECPFFGTDDPAINAQCRRLENASQWEGAPRAEQYQRADAYARDMARGSNRACLVYAHYAHQMLGRGTLLRSTRDGIGHASLVLDGGVVLDINEGVTTVAQICRTVRCIEGMDSPFAK